MKKSRAGVFAGVSALITLSLLAINWRQLEKRQVDDGINRDLVNRKMPASLALTTQAVGPFRGLISNTLWWRATRLQDEGQHFEAIQLADWISSLQPKIVEVWKWQAWNMSFNVSVAYDEPEEQWKWVMAGVDLLRHKGLRYNPGNRKIGNQIAEILWLKMRDDPYRQQQWALEMDRYLKRGDRLELTMLLNAAIDERELVTRPGVAAFLSQCEAAGLTLPQVVAIMLNERPKADLPSMVQPIFDDPATAPARSDVRSYGARKRLTQKHRIDLKTAIALDEDMGPLDWRTFQAHVIYWGATNRDENTGFRSVRQALTDSFFSGSLLYVDEKGASFGANLGLAANVHRYVVEFSEKNPKHKGAQSLNKMFHEMAVLILYTQMYEAQSKVMFEDYKTHLMTDAEKKRWTFESFIAEKAPLLYQNVSIARGRALIYATLSQAYFWVGSGDAYRAKGYERLAKLMWKRARRRAIGRKTLDLEPFEEMCKTVLAQGIAVNSPYPKDVANNLRAMATGVELLELKQPVDNRPEIDLGEDAHDGY